MPAKPVKKKRTTVRKKTTRTVKKSTTKAVDPVKSIQPGHKVWVLEDVPFGMRFPGLVFDKTRKAQLFIGQELNAYAKPFVSKPYSLARWIENDINKGNSNNVDDLHSVHPMVPRSDQAEDIEKINQSFDSGSRGFFLTSQTGTGKTIVSVSAAKYAASRRKSRANILVIANRPASICIPDFRRTIAAVGDGGHNWLVTTLDRVGKVKNLDVDWDVIIVDEAHGFRSEDTIRTKSLIGLGEYKKSPKSAPFIIWMTATPAHNPTELTYLAPLLAQSVGQPASDWIGKDKDSNRKFIQSLKDNGFHIVSGRYGKTWTEDPEERATDIKLFRGWLTTGVPRTLYREAPWGQAPIELKTVELNPQQRGQYESDWEEFKKTVEAAKNSGNGSKGRAAVLRWRQKALVLRIEDIAEWAKSQLELDNQVVLYTDFVGVGAEPLSSILQDMKINVAHLYGNEYDTPKELEDFHSGHSPIAVTTMSASINLQSGAISPSGKKATTNQRVGAMTAPLYSGLKGRQVIGRTHRDGQISPWFVMAGEDTVEERIAGIMIERFATSDGLAGADTSAIESVAKILGVEWLDLSDDDQNV